MSTLTGTLALVALLTLPSSASAKIYHSKQGALKLAFPRATRIASKNIFLNGADVARIKKLCGEAPASKLIRTYVGFNGKTITGYALIETFVVRTLPATMMFVLDPKGSISAIHVLAFHEPLEYQPPKRWLAQFKKKNKPAQTVLGRHVAGIAGSTLSAQAVSKRARLAMTITRVAIVEKSSGK